MAACVVVTRPAAQAAEWVAQLTRHDVPAVAVPLIGIEAPHDVSAVRAAWAHITSNDLIVFVSPNAAEQFFALRPNGSAWPPHLPAASPGPGTSSLLRQLGVPAALIIEPAADAAQFDSEALWQQLAARDWKGAKALVVRGETGRDWLADQFRHAGSDVSFLQAYQRTDARLDAHTETFFMNAMADLPGHLWFFSSSQSVDQLVALAPAQSWADGRAVATHPRIAERAAGAGFSKVLTCRPTFDAVLACIKSVTSQDPP